MALNQDEIIEGMEIKMEVEEEATNSEVQVDVAGSEEESDKALSNSNPPTPKRGRGRPPKKGSVSKSDKSLSNGNPVTPKRGRGRPPKKGSVSKSDKSLSNGNPVTPKRGRGRPPKIGSVSKSDNALSNCNPVTPKRGRPKGSVFMKTKMLKVIGLAAACLPRKPVDPSPKKRGRPSKVESIRKILTPDEEEELKKLESQLRPLGRPRIYPRKDSPVTEPRGRGRPRKTEAATKSPIYDGPPRKRGRPPGAANKVKRKAEQDKANSEPPVKRSFHAKEKSKEAGFPPVEESDQEDETGWVDQESEKWKVEYREDPKKPVTPSDPTSFLWASHITPKRGRPKGSVSKLLASHITPSPKGSVSKLVGSPITPKRGRPKGSVSKLLGSPITPKRGRPKGSVSKLLASPITPKRGRPKGSVSKLLGSPITPNRGRPKGSVSKLLGSPITPNRGRPKGSVSKLLGSPITPNRGRPKGSVSKLLGSPITPNRGRPKGSVSKLLGSPITPNRGRPKGSVSKLLGSPITPNRGRPKGSVSKLLASPITPNRGRPKGSVSKLGDSPITANRGRPKGSVSKLGDSPITANRGRPKGSVSKLGDSPITANRGRPKGSVSKLGDSPTTPKRGRPKGSVFTQLKMLKETGKQLRGRPREVVDLSLDKHGRPSIVQLKRGRPKKILTPDEEEELKKLESQLRPLGRPRIYPRKDSPVTEPRGRGRPRKTEAATKSPIYDGPPRKRGRPPGAANKVKRKAEQDKANSEPPVKRSFHTKEKSKEAGFPPVEESDQEDETGWVDQESEKWKVEYREDPKKPVTPSDPTSFLWASHITPKRGRPKGSVSKLLASHITPSPKGSVSKLLASPITPNRGRPKGSVSKLLANPITPNRGRPKGSVSKLGVSHITPKGGWPKGSVFTQPKMLKVMRKPLRGRPSKVESIRKILTPKEEEDRKKLESQPRRPLGRPRIYTRDDPPVTEPRGRGRPRKTEDATKPLIYDGPPRKRGRPPGAANKVKRKAEQDKANSEPPVKRSFHSKEKTEEAGFPPVEESDQEDETGRVDEENETGKNIEKSPRSQLPPVTVIALSVP
ncbi:serine/arginine repetitive matrix protein 2-like isoform X2 [Salvelinus namaycush]|uniref:Serine/arginine repetitive matrix protein 2-like isoform X2 n=1 Tax=Salvelinus namaycush TaxID=8040 RepID=A0A8U0PAR6_SALNM|nr:serine/arginine repetitive matrix protein 2-like isoform X2 [Salvelinus namaycush]